MYGHKTQQGRHAPKRRAEPKLQQRLRKPANQPDGQSQDQSQKFDRPVQIGRQISEVSARILLEHGWREYLTDGNSQRTEQTRQLQDGGITPAFHRTEQPIGYHQVDVQIQHDSELADDDPSARVPKPSQRRPFEVAQAYPQARRQHPPNPDRPDSGYDCPGQDGCANVFDPRGQEEEEQNDQPNSS